MTADVCDELAERKRWGSGKASDRRDGLLPRKFWIRSEDDPEDIMGVA